MRRLPPLPPDIPASDKADPRAALGPCPLCGREMVAGASVDAHHLVPKSEGGRETVMLHRICHRRIHAEFTERELRDRYSSVEALRDHPAIADFIRWVARKPPEFMKATFKAKSRE